LSEILTPEIDLLLRKVAASEAVQKALNTGNAGIAHQHLRRSSRYAKTPSGSTVIFLASLESGRRALVDYSKETRCEAKAMVVAMTPPNGPTLLTHYLPRPPGLHIALDAGGLKVRVEQVKSQLEFLAAYHEAREGYVAQNREQLQTIARREGREDLACSPESIDAIIRSAFGLSEGYLSLWSYANIVGYYPLVSEEVKDLIEAVSPRGLDYLSKHTIAALAQGRSPDLEDPESRQALTKQLLTQPWSSISTPLSTYHLWKLEDHIDTSVAPDSTWSVATVWAHVHPFLSTVVPQSFEDVVPDGYNIFSATDVLRAIGAQGLPSFISNAISDVTGWLKRYEQKNKAHSKSIDMARTLLEEGENREGFATLDRAVQDVLEFRSAIQTKRQFASSESARLSFEIDKHELLLSRTRDEIQQGKVVLRLLQEAKNAEDIIGALFHGLWPGGTFGESQRDMFNRRWYHAQYQSGSQKPSISIIENPFGSFYALGDGDSGLTNQRYEGPGESRTPTVRETMWLHGDRLSAVEIVMSHDAKMQKIPQSICDMVILDQVSGSRRFAVRPPSSLEWLITKRTSAVEAALGHQIPISTRMVGDVPYTFVEWPNSGTLQPESIRKILKLSEEFAIDSWKLLTKFDRFYRAAPHYEKINPLHVHMPRVCIKDPKLMEEYLGAASAISDQAQDLPKALASLLRISENRGETSVEVRCAVCFITHALALFSSHAEEGNRTAIILRLMLNSEEFLCSLKEAIASESFYFRTFEAWEKKLTSFFLEEYAGCLETKLHEAGVFDGILVVKAAEVACQGSGEDGATFITAVQQEPPTRVTVSVDIDRFLRAFNDAYPIFADALRRFSPVVDKSDTFPRARQGDTSYLQIREELFATLNNHDFETELPNRLTTLRQRGLSLRFWDLAIGPGDDHAAVAKFNQALLKSLGLLCYSTDERPFRCR
jgi:hypothetical protein